MLDELNREAFAQHLNSTFQVQSQTPEGADATIEMKLVEAKDSQHHAPEKGHESFSLLFEGPREMPLEQGTYEFEHAELGQFALFIVPISQDDQSRYYEAIFNRMTDAPAA